MNKKMFEIHKNTLKSMKSPLVFLCLILLIVSCQKKPDISKLDCWNNMVMSNIIKTGNLDALNQIEQKLNVAIKMTINEVNIKTLYQEGIMPRTILQNVVTADVPLNKLLKLTSYDFIKAIKIYDKRHEVIPFPDSINTKLFIGIIDVGFGFHKDYFSNRIFSYWDQTASTSSPGTNIPGLNYGVEYGRADIVKRFYDEGLHRLGLHGSFCSLLAGGNKFDTHLKNIDNKQLSNVAAPLIIVETTKDEGDIIDAIYYIKKKSQQYNAKCVINLSESKHNGGHDGTSFLSKAINEMVSDSCLIVVSSGNDGALNIHNHQKFIDSTYVDFAISYSSKATSNKKGIYIHSYYEKNRNVEVKLYSPEGFCGKVKKGEWEKISYGYDKISLSNAISQDETTLKNDILLVIEPTTRNKRNEAGDSDDWMVEPNKKKIIGDWILVFKNTDADSIEINSWIVSQLGFNCKFKIKNDCIITSSDLCSASKVISVGGYVLKNDSLLLSSHTGRGSICDAINSPSCISPFSIEIGINNKSADGTSFSAPLIVRTITKIWEKYPEVTGDEIRKFLDKKMVVFNDSDYNRKTDLNYETINWEDINQYFLHYELQ